MTDLSGKHDAHGNALALAAPIALQTESSRMTPMGAKPGALDAGLLSPSQRPIISLATSEAPTPPVPTTSPVHRPEF